MQPAQGAETDSNQSLPVPTPTSWMVLYPPTCSITGDHRMQRRCLKRVLYWGHPHARHRRGRSLAQRIQEWMNPSKCLPLSPDTLRTALLPVGNTGAQGGEKIRPISEDRRLTIKCRLHCKPTLRSPLRMPPPYHRGMSCNGEKWSAGWEGVML